MLMRIIPLPHYDFKNGGGGGVKKAPWRRAWFAVSNNIYMYAMPEKNFKKYRGIKHGGKGAFEMQILVQSHPSVDSSHALRYYIL